MLRAVLWDVDGTLAETERDGHRVAFNRAFEDADLAWRWDVARYGELLEIAGGRERLLHDLSSRSDAPSTEAGRQALASLLHRVKNDAYARIVARGGIALRPGVARLIEACRAAGIAQAIATTTSRGNVDALLASTFGDGGAALFAATVCAEDAPAKKPDPLVYRIALARLGVDAAEALAIEDSPNGVAAATAAGIATLVTKSVYFADAQFASAAAICDDLDSPVCWAGGAASRVDVDVLKRFPRAVTAMVSGADAD